MAENEKEIELSKLAQHVAMATLSHPFTQEPVLKLLDYECFVGIFLKLIKGASVNAIRI